MIDIHTHILNNIDDGSKSLEESFEMIQEAYKNNVTDIVLTPHYIKGTKYNADNNSKTEKFEELKKWCSISNINVNLYLGNEVYVTDDTISLEKEIMTINNTKYILIELPLNTKYNLLDEYIIKLKKKKLVPIIAHPERYIAYYKDYDFFNNLIDKGCLLQGNISSIYGKYGRKSKKMLKYMLKNNMISFIATDIHSPKNKIYTKNIKEDLYKIIKDEKKVEDLLCNNQNKVLHNLDI